MDPVRLGQSLCLTSLGRANHTDEPRMSQGSHSSVDSPREQLRVRAPLNSISFTPEAATCTVSGDPHYLTFDGTLHHFTGTCSYILTRPCQSRSLENYFIVSATNEFRSGNLEASYVRSVHLHIFNLRISLIKGHKVMVRASARLPWPLHHQHLFSAPSLPTGPPVWLLEPLGEAHSRSSPQFRRHITIDVCCLVLAPLSLSQGLLPAASSLPL